MISVLYVSKTLIEPRYRHRVLQDVLVKSIERNTALDITGVLIAAPQHFAHVLEGPDDAVRSVLACIEIDPRQSEMRVIREMPVIETRYSNWRMARLDSSALGKSFITPILAAAHAGVEPDAVERLEQLIEAAGTGAGFIHQPGSGAKGSPVR